MPRTYVEPSERQRARAYSPAVITQGGRIIWMAGQTATEDADGTDISGNFERQTQRVFSLMDQTLRRAGGTLASLVTMTVFIKEPRHGEVKSEPCWITSTGTRSGCGARRAACAWHGRNRAPRGSRATDAARTPRR
jgi:enamine deaminase RidA (YjgF/YER057c/UK114 family)